MLHIDVKVNNILPAKSGISCIRWLGLSDQRMDVNSSRIEIVVLSRIYEIELE